MNHAYTLGPVPPGSTHGVPDLAWLCVLALAVTAAVWPLIRWYRARPVMSGRIDVRPRSGTAIAIPVQNRRTVTHRVGDGTLRISGCRDGGAPRIRLVFSTGRGHPVEKTMVPGGRVMIAANDIRHCHPSAHH
ncbi:hypothetical protein [Actinoplanes sp. NPDC051851]|uniref:hypothetical protein n=1 Tax=Actinoplanes sp. NPDC051851 TaxID=3154753 RepID=UPI0034170319